MDSDSTWRINGTASELYEQFIVPAWMDEWAQILVENVNIDSGAKVLDIACGTGIVARKAASLVGKHGAVSGLDADRAMLSTAKKCAIQENVHQIIWYQADAMNLPFTENEYNIVLCQQGLQFFSDKLTALKQMYRVLCSDGKLGISVWRSIDRCPFLAILGDILGKYIGNEIKKGFYASCSLGDREELRKLLENAGFRNTKIRIESRMVRYKQAEKFLFGYLSVFPIIGEKINKMENADRETMFADINSSMGDFIDDFGLAVPMESYIIIGNK